MEEEDKGLRLFTASCINSSPDALNDGHVIATPTSPFNCLALSTTLEKQREIARSTRKESLCTIRNNSLTQQS